jgi:flagellar hook-length control protein FliK
VVAQQAAQGTLPLAAAAQQRPDAMVTKRDAGALPPAAASDVSKLLADKGSQATVLPAAQTVPVLAQQAGQQSGFAARDETPMPTVAASAHGKPDILPADVRLMFRKEMQQAGLAEQAASTAVHEAAEMVAGQRQILPPVLTSTAPGAVAQEWRIDPPMARTAEWQSAFGEKVGSMVALKLDSASIQVSPENLGPLDISIRFDSQDQAAISVVAANPEAKAIVESSLPQLARMLEHSGIQLGSTQVSTQQQAQQQAQEQAQQQARRQGRQPGHKTAQEPALPEPELALSAVSTRQNGLSIHA